LLQPPLSGLTNGSAAVVTAHPLDKDLMQRALIVLGVIFLALGLVWPWISKLGLGRLPGDIHIERDGFGLFFPITTGIIVSIVISLILWLLRK
jgi:fucose permease